MHLLKETNLLQGTTTQICHESLKKRFCLQMLNLWSNSFSSYHMICAMLYYWMLTWISWFHAELLPQGLPRIMFGTRYLDGITIYKLYEDELIIFTTVHFFAIKDLPPTLWPLFCSTDVMHDTARMLIVEWELYFCTFLHIKI